MAIGPEASAPSAQGESHAGPSQRLSGPEMRALCEPLLQAHQAVGEAVDRERVLAWRLAGSLAGLLLGAFLLAAVERGPPPLGASVAWGVVLAFFGTLIVAPRPLLSGIRRWIRAGEPPGATDPSDSAILYRAVRTVHQSAESAERLWAAVIVLGVLLAPVAGIFSFVLVVDLLLAVVPASLANAGAVAFPLLLIVAGSAVALTLLWVVRRLGQLERLRAILSAQLTGLERLEVALWVRF